MFGIAHVRSGQRTRTSLCLKLLEPSALFLISVTIDINDVTVLGREVELELQPLIHHCRQPDGESVLTASTTLIGDRPKESKHPLKEAFNNLKT
jgi:hypothetical protein